VAVANVTPKAATGGLQTKLASELKGSAGVCMVIFGQGGAGKTTLACTAQDTPHGQDVLLVDVDLGVESVSDRSDIHVMQPTEWKVNTAENMSLYTIASRLKAQGDDVKHIGTVVFDSITAIYEMILKDILKASPTPDMPSQPEYGKANMALQQLLQDMRALSRKGIHVVFICHAKEETTESGMVLTRLALTPGVTNAITRIVDHIGFLTMDMTSGNRKLVFKPNPKVTAKFRQPRTGPQLPLELLNPSMAQIIEHVRKAKEAK
jgi:phage nucleotide-binding protein